MHIMMPVEITERQRKHINECANDFYEEVIKRVRLTRTDLIVMGQLMLYKHPKTVYSMRWSFRKHISYTSWAKSIRKLYVIGILNRRKSKESGKPYEYWFKRRAP